MTTSEDRDSGEQSQPDPQWGNDDHTPVVAVGASAGGLTAFRKFLEKTPSKTGVAFVLVQHLDPTHESTLAELLGRMTEMPVSQAEEGTHIEPDHVYVIPPGGELTIEGDVLHVGEPRMRRGVRTPIDVFFESLARDRGDRAICIVLSGAGSDGTAGLKAVKAAGGLALVQEPASAEYDSMPSSAIATRLADRVLDITDMPDALLAYVRHSRRNGDIHASQGDEQVDHLREILNLIRLRTGHDFRAYKVATLERRIQRRMSLAQLSDAGDYLERLRRDPDELKALIKDMLITVTSFFREPENWDALAPIVDGILSSKTSDEPVRAWVAGCASGEEAFTMAILLHERMEALQKDLRTQVFATDVSPDAFEMARSGVYPESVANELSAERLARYFHKVGQGYEVRSWLRERVTFAAQNVINDPPFSKLDLITCRNLLIYLEPEAQRRVLALFHFALNPGGILFLGASETVGPQHELFRAVDKKHRIYRRVDSAARPPLDITNTLGHDRPRRTHVPYPERRPPRRSEVAHRLLLAAFAPPSVLVDSRGAALYFHGDTTPYLAQPGGEPTADVVELARPGIRARLRAALHKADQSGERLSVQGMRPGADGESVPVRLDVEPHEHDDDDKVFLVSFHDIADLEGHAELPPESSLEESTVVRQLEEELRHTREELQGTVEEMETSNEELKASNEEVMSMNEELQSTNEELETSKEELQSVNEELTTLNQQLQDKLEELERVNNDLSNLLTSTNIATVFLDTRFRVKRYTEAATKLFKLIPADVGRPADDVSWRFDDPRLLEDAHAVLDDLHTREAEIRSEEGGWYLRRIQPYRTQDDRIDGVTVTFANVTKLKEYQQALGESEERFRTALEGSPITVFQQDRELRYTWVYNPTAGVDAERLMGRTDREVFGEADAGELERHKREVLESGHGKRIAIAMEVDGFERDYDLTIEPHRTEDGELVGITCASFDITEPRRAERERLVALERLRVAMKNAPIVAAQCDRDLRYTWLHNPHADYEAAGILGKRDDELAAPDAVAELMEIKRRVIESGTGERRELTLGHLSDGAHTYDIVAEPLRDHDGRVIGASTSAVDITHLKRIQLELAEKAAELAEADRRKDEFLAMLGHELRNPLAPIMTSLDLLDTQKDPDRREHLLAVVRRQSEQLTRLVDDLLDVSRITRGKITLRSERVRVADIITRAVDTVRPLVDERNLSLEIDIQDGDAMLQADQARLSQVVANLLHNAAKYTDPGGHIWLKASRNDDEATIEVKDDGMGIVPELLPHVFEVFAQGDKSLQRAQGGLGIGLTLVHRLVTLHDGRVEVHSEGRGQGSRFVVRLPLAASIKSDPVPENPPAGRGRKAERILVVDDNLDAAEMLASLLAQKGAEVRVAHDGSRALRLAQDIRPDVALLDIGLPGMSGYELATQMRAKLGNEVHLIAITGYGQREDVAHAKAAGFDEHMVKPIDHERLLRSLGLDDD